MFISGWFVGCLLVFDCCIGAVVIWFVCFDLVDCGLLAGCDLGLFIVFILVLRLGVYGL